jgi:hypothetical protein
MQNYWFRTLSGMKAKHGKTVRTTALMKRSDAEEHRCNLNS